MRALLMGDKTGRAEMEAGRLGRRLRGREAWAKAVGME